MGMLIGMIISILLARELGKTERGIYALTILLPELLVTLLNLGIGPATVYFIGKENIFQNRLSVRISVWLFGYLSSAFGRFHPGFVNWEFIISRVPRPYLLMGLFIIPISLMTTYLVSIFHGSGFPRLI